ncbi:MAG: PEP-CTERM sorting domain-containing protein [Terrimicrobiaceae bacterium]
MNTTFTTGNAAINTTPTKNAAMNTTPTKNAAMNTNMSPQRSGPLAFCLPSRNAAPRFLRHALIACAIICAAPHVRAAVIIQQGWDSAPGDTNPTIYYLGAAAGAVTGFRATTPATGAIGAITGNFYLQSSSSSQSGEVINFPAVTLLAGDHITLSFNYSYLDIPTGGTVRFGFFNSNGPQLSASGNATSSTTSTFLGYFGSKAVLTTSSDVGIYKTLATGAGVGGINFPTTPTLLGAKFSSGVGLTATYISHSVSFTLALGTGNVLTQTLIFDGTSYVRTDSTPVTTTFNEFYWDPVTYVPSGLSGTMVDNLLVVPEPATWALLAFSLTTVVVMRRRKS